MRTYEYVTEYVVSAVPETIDDWALFAVTVARTAPDRWAVRLRAHRCLGVDGQWDWEPIPSEREDDWLATHRFDLETALRMAREVAPTIKVNGITAEQALAEVVT